MGDRTGSLRPRQPPPERARNAASCKLDPEPSAGVAAVSFSLGLPAQNPRLPLSSRKSKTPRAGRTPLGHYRVRSPAAPGAMHLPARPHGAAASSSSGGSSSGRAARPGAGALLAATFAGVPEPDGGGVAGSHLCERPAASYVPSGPQVAAARLPPCALGPAARAAPCAPGGPAPREAVPGPRPTRGVPRQPRAGCQGEGRVRAVPGPQPLVVSV